MHDAASPSAVSHPDHAAAEVEVPFWTVYERYMRGGSLGIRRWLRGLAARYCLELWDVEGELLRFAVRYEDERCTPTVWRRRFICWCRHPAARGRMLASKGYRRADVQQSHDTEHGITAIRCRRLEDEQGALTADARDSRPAPGADPPRGVRLIQAILVAAAEPRHPAVHAWALRCGGRDLAAIARELAVDERTAEKLCDEGRQRYTARTWPLYVAVRRLLGDRGVDIAAETERNPAAVRMAATRGLREIEERLVELGLVEGPAAQGGGRRSVGVQAAEPLRAAPAVAVAAGEELGRGLGL